MNETENKEVENKDTTVVEENKKKKRGPLSFLLDTLKGITLGISAAVPGLSAGTIAVAEQCYDTLIDAITGLRKAFKKNFLILLPYLLGLLLGAVAALVGIQRGYQVAPFTLTGLFAGCVLGSLPVAISELRRGNTAKERTNHILSFLICLLVAAGLGIITALTKFDLQSYLVDRVWWMYLLTFAAGVIAAAACIVPGISGSMSLMVIGMYYPILNSYTGDQAIWHSGESSFIGTGLVLGLLLIVGALLGVILSSKIMKRLLSDHRVTTFYGILGLILGSLVSMFINSSIYPRYTGSNNTAIIQGWDYIVGSILLVATSVGMFFFIRYTQKKKAEVK